MAADAKQGSCGYGQMDSSTWPYFACVGISESSALFGLPGKGCGVCVEVQCVESGPVRAQPAQCMQLAVIRNNAVTKEKAGTGNCCAPRQSLYVLCTELLSI